MANRSELKGRLKNIYGDTEEVLRNIFESIRTERVAYLESARQILRQISGELEEIMVMIRNQPSVGKNHSLDQVLDHYARSRENFNSLIEAAQQKVEQRVVFGDKAIQEMEYLMGSTKYLFRCLGEAILNRNQTLLKYINDTASSLEDSAEKFSLEHEERLIAGLCQPETSSVYLGLIDNFKKIHLSVKDSAYVIIRLREE